MRVLASYSDHARLLIDLFSLSRSARRQIIFTRIVSPLELDFSTATYELSSLLSPLVIVLTVLPQTMYQCCVLRKTCHTTILTIKTFTTSGNMGDNIDSYEFSVGCLGRIEPAAVVG
jgi:hypothetical protein